MKHKFLILVFLMLGAVAWGLTGEEIINKVDANMTYDTSRSTSHLVIHIRDEVRTKKMISYGEGRDKSYAEFTAPARDKGVKYLKIKDNLWMYLPSVEKVIKIEGHMLRQSMMGSDFSYEDAMESDELLKKYKATVVGEETYDERPCYVIDLVAKVKDVTYYKRRTWVDKERFIPLKEELFALSGKKLKEMTLGKVKRFGRRYYPTYFTMKNLLRQDSLTEMFIDEIVFDIKLPAGIFTQRNLTK